MGVAYHSYGGVFALTLTVLQLCEGREGVQRCGYLYECTLPAWALILVLSKVLCREHQGAHVREVSGISSIDHGGQRAGTDGESGWGWGQHA